MGLFALGAVAAAAASSIDLMLIARFIQGLGAASAVVLSRAIVRDVATGKEAAKLMSLMMMIFTVAPVVAPSIGAILVSQWGWRAPFIAIAILGFGLLGAIHGNITETHTPNSDQHPLRQLKSSFVEFFSHRQSIFGLLMIILPPAGFMSIITVSAALVVEIYGYSLHAFGLIFAAAGLSILLGAFINRLLVVRFDMLQLIGLGAVVLGLVGVQMLAMMWLANVAFWWLWGNVCLYMLTIAILAPNATVLALDPMGKIAGVASSIIGTIQNLIGAFGAIVGALIYDGSVRTSILIMTATALLTLGIFLLRPLIAPTIVHHPHELARE